MNLIRNILILVAVVVIGIMAVQFLSNIVPIIITAIAAFILGRLSVHYDLVGMIRARMAAAPAQAAAATPAVEAAPKAVAKPAPSPAKTTVGEAVKPAPAQATPKAAEAAKRLADEPQNSVLLDESFEIKTPEQIEAEARRREQELAQKTAAPNPDAVQAALEERRKRLLGGQQE